MSAEQSLPCSSLRLSNPAYSSVTSFHLLFAQRRGCSRGTLSPSETGSPLSSRPLASTTSGSSKTPHSLPAPSPAEPTDVARSIMIPASPFLPMNQIPSLARALKVLSPLNIRKTLWGRRSQMNPTCLACRRKTILWNCPFPLRRAQHSTAQHRSGQARPGLRHRRSLSRKERARARVALFKG